MQNGSSLAEESETGGACRGRKGPSSYVGTLCHAADIGGASGRAANVSTLRLASPSQRLLQIRRQKKNHTRNEMFSELMQSTQTERAQQNAWRQTMAESRKAQNEREDRWLEQQGRWRQHDERRQDAMLRLLEDQTDMLWCMVEVQERHRLPLQPQCNQPPSSPSSVASSPRCPRTRGEGDPLGTQPLHHRGLPKQQKAGIQ
ncbi:uncharacterized protein [Lepidochelys kempii]